MCTHPELTIILPQVKMFGAFKSQSGDSAVFGVILPCIVKIPQGAVIHGSVCVYMFVYLYGFVSEGTRMCVRLCSHVEVFVCWCIVPQWLFPCCTHACSGDSIVSMSKDLPAALFHHVFIMLIQSEKEQGWRDRGRVRREQEG